MLKITIQEEILLGDRTPVPAETSAVACGQKGLFLG
jgi:hypothetical protein